MLLYDSTYEDMYRVLTQEREKVDFTLEKLSVKAMKEFRDRTVFPAYFINYYTVPASRNKYIVCHYMLSNDKYMDGLGVMILNEDDGAQQVIDVTSCKRFVPTKGMVSIIDKSMPYEERIVMMNIYTAHFLNRYRTRLIETGLISPSKKGTLTTAEIACMYLSRNRKNIISIPYEQMVLMPEKYRNGIALQVNDGIVFGSQKSFTGTDGKEVYVNRLNTIVSRDMLKQSQADNVVPDKTIQHVKVLKELLKERKRRK